MYMNRPRTNCPRRPLEFKLPSFEEDKRLTFVDSVCATLMTSRFGDGAMYTLNPRFEGTADEPLNFLDLLEEDAIGWHEAATVLGREYSGEMLQRRSTGRVLPGQNPARSKGIALADATLGRNLTPCETPANLGRGSPTLLGRSSSCPPLRPSRALREIS